MKFTFFKTRGGSGRIRGDQIAKKLGGRINPKSGFENDICIFVKLQPPETYPKRSYLDIIDGMHRVRWLLNHKDIGVIASSLTGKEYLEEKLQRDIILIPQHHCNYDNIISEGDKVGMVGRMSSMRNFDIKNHIDNYFHDFKFKTREDVIESYKKIKIQIIWRDLYLPLKNPLKVINAASFGIPTVAYPEHAFKEVEGYYWPVTTIDEMKKTVNKLMDGFDKDRLINLAKNYHIDKIADMYRNLL